MIHVLIVKNIIRNAAEHRVDTKIHEINFPSPKLKGYITFL